MPEIAGRQVDDEGADDVAQLPGVSVVLSSWPFTVTKPVSGCGSGSSAKRATAFATAVSGGGVLISRPGGPTMSTRMDDATSRLNRVSASARNVAGTVASLARCAPRMSE
jgi:hypothetical protein